MTLGTGELFSRSFYGKYCMGGLGWLTKPSINQSSKDPPLALFPSPFISVFHSPFCVHVLILLFWGTGLSSHSIPRVVGGCWKSARAWFWVWACQMRNSVLLCWRLFSCPFPVPSLPLVLGDLGGAECKTVLGHVHVPFLGLSLGVLGRLLSSA